VLDEEADMQEADPHLARLNGSFVALYRELLEGVPDGSPTWITTGGRSGGAYGTLDDVTAEEASRDVNGTTLAAHAYHMYWAIEAANKVFAGKPSGSWSESWAVHRVTPDEWDELRTELRRAGEELLANAATKQDWRADGAADGAIASFGHAAYHLGALRQLKKAAKR
jgi:hypothetical protein